MPAALQRGSPYAPGYASLESTGPGYAQSIVTCGYGGRIPASETPVGGAFIASMAQAEDRGANYAIRDGRRAAALIDAWLDRTTPGTFPGPRHC